MTRDMQLFVSEAAPIIKRLWQEYSLSRECQLYSLSILGRRYKEGQLMIDIELECYLAVSRALREYSVMHV